MNECYVRHGTVDISEILKLLHEVRFVDTGGPNGWLASPNPDWMDQFIRSLEPPGEVVFPMMRLLPPFQNLPPHKDTYGNLANTGRRFHVPLISHPDVVMAWPDDGVEVHLAPGWLWEVNYHKLHEVRHRANVGRIHLHYNVLGGAA